MLFVDGRYTLQVREQVDTSLFTIEHLVETPPDRWIETNLTSADRLGYDPWLHTVESAERLAKACAAAGATLVAVEPDLIDAIWSDRPAPPLGAVTLHDLRFAGEAAEEKLARIRAELAKLRADALVVSDPHAVAWAFNIRGADVAHTPLPLAFAVVPQAGRPALFVDGRKLSNDVRDRLEGLADVREPADFVQALAALGQARKTVRLDQATAADALARLVITHGGKVARGACPIALMKAVKNQVEISGARAAHIRDGAAVTRFLAWFDREAARGTLTEIDAVAALESFRRDTGLLKDISFPTISGAGPDGAIVHYRVTSKTNRAIAPGELFLIDSGGQYQDGTTDITRTVAVGEPTAEMRERFTRVLKGHIAIARAVFPDGTTGAQLELVCAAILVGAGARLRSRHRTWRRQLSLGARRPGAHLQAGHDGAPARHDPLERARLLQSRRLRHPHRESCARGGGRRRPRRRETAQCFRDAHAGAHRPSADRGQYAHARRDGVARRLSCARRADAVAARRRRDARVARGRHPPARAKLNPLGYPVLDPTTKGTTRSEARPTRWRLLALLIAMTGVSSLSLNILVPAIPSLVAKFAADPASVQLTVSLYLLGLAVAQLVFGPLSDRFGRRPVVLAGLALATIASTAAIFAASISSLIVARVAQSLGASTGQTIGRAIIRDLYDREHAASMIGLVTSVVVLMPMAAPLIGGILDTLFGWEAIFVFTAALSFTVFAWAMLALPETHTFSTAPGGWGRFSADVRALAAARGSSATRYAPGSARRPSSAFSAALPMWW